MYFLWYILIGLGAGYVAGVLVKGSGSGLLVNIVVGIVGGVLGGWILSLFGVLAVGTIGSLFTAVIGSIVLLWIVALLSPRKRK